MAVLFYCENDPERLIENQLRAALPVEHFISCPQHSETRKNNSQSNEDNAGELEPGYSLADIDIAIVWNPPDDFFDGLGNLKVIFSLAAGVDHLLNHKGLEQLGAVDIVRLEDAGMGQKMAEYVLYGVLRAQRKFHYYSQCQRRQHWAHDAGTVYAANFHIGILGLGTLGACVAERLLINGYRVSGWTRNKKTLAGVHCFHGPDGLDTLLAAVDTLVCLLPLTSSTRHILNAELFRKVKPGLFLINLARGGHLDQTALSHAIKSNHLSGALLDVTDPEPLPKGHPFWSDPAICITPHIAGPTQERESVAQIATNIKHFRKGESMSGLVDQSAGY